MHKIFFGLCTLFISIFAYSDSEPGASFEGDLQPSSWYEPQLRSEEELASSPWTDHIVHFAKLFQIQKIHSFLEFGVGEGTKYYLEHCDEVTSIELLDSSKINNVVYYEQCLALFKSYSNWHPILYLCEPHLERASIIAEKWHVDPTTLNREYMKEIHYICDVLFENKSYDVAFVDAGIAVRGSIVNALFDRVDIIAAHDTNALPKTYGWAWVKKPSNYERIVFTEGSGTCFWIKKSRVEIIKELKRLKKP